MLQQFWCDVWMKFTHFPVTGSKEVTVLAKSKQKRQCWVLTFGIFGWWISSSDACRTDSVGFRRRLKKSPYLAQSLNVQSRTLCIPPSKDSLERLSQFCCSLLTTQAGKCRRCIHFWSEFATNLRKVTPKRCRLTAFCSFPAGLCLTVSPMGQYLSLFSDAVGHFNDDDVKR